MKMMSKTKCVYLAGPIDHSDSPSEWRDEVEYVFDFHGIATLDPMRGKTLVDGKTVGHYTINEIVQRDLNDIKNSNLVLVYIPAWSKVVGTIMEIVYAKLYGVPVFLVTPDVSMFEGPWIKYHVTRCFDSLDEAMSYVIEELPAWA